MDIEFLAEFGTTLSKNIVKWLQTTLQHSMKETQNNPKYRPNIEMKDAPNIVPQTDTRLSSFKLTMSESDQDDDAVYYGAHLAFEVTLGMTTSMPPSTQ